METSPEIKTISAAILEAQKNTGAAIKDAKNPFFKSSYADLGAVMEVCKGALNAAGITCLQPVVSEGADTFVETYLIHSSGEWFKSRQRIVCKAEHDPQAQGSAITYAKRYSLQSLLFIPSEDDDGNRATKPPAPKYQAPAPAPEKVESKIIAGDYNCPPGGRPAPAPEPTIASLPPLAHPAGAPVVEQPSGEISGTILSVEKREGKAPARKPYWAVSIKTDNGEQFVANTDVEDLACEARDMIGRPAMAIHVERNGKFLNFISVAPF